MDRLGTGRRGLAACLLTALCALVCAQAAGAKSAYVESRLREVRPPVSGLDLRVTGGDKFLILRNGSTATILVKGYDDEPYLRFLPNKVVQENTRSPSKYVNDDRYGLSPVPAQADSKASPRWKQVSRDGTYRWFDHRIHLMEKGTPSQVKDESKQTKIFDWRVPLNVGSRPGAAVGTLTWKPASSDSGSSAGPIVGIAAAVVLLLGGAALLLSRRRRGPPAAAGPPEEKPVKEVW
jgi:LPXTG-motif cell wall-anchored protein